MLLLTLPIEVLVSEGHITLASVANVMHSRRIYEREIGRYKDEVYAEPYEVHFVDGGKEYVYRG